MQTVRQRKPDVVIMMLHWGFEYQAQVDPAQHLAQSLFEQADLVVAPSAVKAWVFQARSSNHNWQPTAWEFWFTQEAPGTDRGWYCAWCWITRNQGIRRCQLCQAVITLSHRQGSILLQRLLYRQGYPVRPATCAQNDSTDISRAGKAAVFSGLGHRVDWEALELVRGMRADHCV
jgi:hypothetical protein